MPVSLESSINLLLILKVLTFNLKIIDKRENEISDTLYDAKYFFASMPSSRKTHNKFISIRSRSSNVS